MKGKITKHEKLNTRQWQFSKACMLKSLKVTVLCEERAKITLNNEGMLHEIICVVLGSTNEFQHRLAETISL